MISPSSLRCTSIIRSEGRKTRDYQGSRKRGDGAEVGTESEALEDNTSDAIGLVANTSKRARALAHVLAPKHLGTSQRAL